MGIWRSYVEHEQEGNLRYSYGKSVLQEFSNRLTEEFDKGFSVRTLQQMKKFYAMIRASKDIAPFELLEN